MAALTSKEYVDAHSGGSGGGTLGPVSGMSQYGLHYDQNTSLNLSTATEEEITPGSSAFASLGLDANKYYILQYAFNGYFAGTDNTTKLLINLGYATNTADHNKFYVQATNGTNSTYFGFSGNLIVKGSDLNTFKIKFQRESGYVNSGTVRTMLQLFEIS